MVALTGCVRALRTSRGGGESVPWFDPAEGGVRGRILILGEAPGPRALGVDSPRPNSKGSGFISPDNNDGTAANCWTLIHEAGIDRSDLVTWNIVPWYVGDGQRIRAANADDLREAAPALRDLLALLPDLRVVVLYGRKAAAGWAAAGMTVPFIEVPHPSPTNLNTRPESRAKVLAGLRAAQRILDEPTP